MPQSTVDVDVPQV